MFVFCWEFEDKKKFFWDFLTFIDSYVDRGDIFLTTKLWPTDYGKYKTQKAAFESMKRLDTDYLDLYVMHLPVCPSSIESTKKVIQVNLFQKHLFLHQLHQQYDKRLFIELQVLYMKIASPEHGQNILCTQIVFCFCFDIQNNLCKQHVLTMFSPCSKLGILMYVLNW